MKSRLVCLSNLIFLVAVFFLNSCKTSDPVSAIPPNHDSLPQIILQPFSQAANLGTRCVLSVRAISDSRLFYQWYKNGIGIGGATDSDYVISSVAMADSGQYTVTVANAFGSVTSDSAFLGVSIPVSVPQIVLHPQSQTTILGVRCVLSVRAMGQPVPAYQWQKNGSEISGAIDSNLVFAAVTMADTGAYTVVVSNSVGSTTSYPAIIEVGLAPSPLKPDSQIIRIGARCTLQVEPLGNPAPAVQWLHNGVLLAGATTNRIIIDSFAVRDSGLYVPVLTNRFGMALGIPVRLDAAYLPFFTLAPKTQSVSGGEACTLSVRAGGYPGPALQWHFGTSPIVGARDTNYVISNFVGENAGEYFAVATNKFGADTSISAKITLAGSKLKCFSAGLAHSLFVKPNDSLYACGSNGSGQLGIGRASIQEIIPLGIMSDIKKVAAGHTHSMILKNDGSLWACGSNQFGQLGIGTTSSNVLSPVQVLSGIQDVAAANSYTLILDNNGSLWACGANANGQLGDGTTSNRLSPVLIMTNVARISAGNLHSLVVKSDSTLWAFGYNFFGQLGDNTKTNQYSPVQVMTGVANASAGGNFSLILKTDGTLWGCGANTYGSLGIGTAENASSPVQIMAGVKSVSAGGSHSLIVKTDHTLWSCGFNLYGQLGDGGITQRLSPVKVMDEIAEVSAGNAHSLILTTKSALFVFGNNDQGRLGDGTGNFRNSPYPACF